MMRSPRSGNISFLRLAVAFITYNVSVLSLPTITVFTVSLLGKFVFFSQCENDRHLFLFKLNIILHCARRVTTAARVFIINFLAIFLKLVLLNYVSLEVTEAGAVRSVQDLPASISTLLECPDPPSKLSCPKYPRFSLWTEKELPITLSIQDYAWLFARSLSRDQLISGTQEEESRQSKVPVWSAYNSLVSEVMPVTRVGAPPLIAAPAHESSTLLTVLMQAQGINTHVR